MAGKRDVKKKKEAKAGSEEPPSKKSKGSVSAVRETFDEFRTRIANQRVSMGSPLDFKFEKARCKMVSDEPQLPKSHSGILYWMSRDQRVQDNWAFVRAQSLALKEKVPLFVCFCLVPTFLQATLRQYAFMLRGLRLVRQELQGLNIEFKLLLGEAKTVLPEFVNKYKIGGIVTDFAPLRTPRKWTEEVARLLPAVPICQVDAHNVVPMWVTSDKLEYAARTIRPKIHKNLPQYLTEYPAIIPHPYKSDAKFADPFENWDELINFLEIDKTVPEVDWAKPGTDEGLQTLYEFLNSRIKDYAEKRNNPNNDVLSNLSPWFHFGQISVARCILEASKSPHKSGKDAFIEEALVRRELSDNFCYYNENYDNINGAYDWAKKTLDDHRKDKRKPLYELQKFETAKTHDDLWNAAQNQLRIEGKMHGFLRMYWAKKILEWTESPERALEIAIYLNDKYNLDGRDPNGFVGCMWSICGIHDQGWKERTIFGKIRYMNFEGCKRKFDVNSFIGKYRKLSKEKGL